jgi:hypothetical protein
MIEQKSDNRNGEEKGTDRLGANGFRPQNYSTLPTAHLEALGGTDVYCDLQELTVSAKGRLTRFKLTN